MADGNLTTVEAQQELQKLQRQAKIQARKATDKSAEIPVEKPGPPEGVTEELEFTDDVKDDTLENARDAGTLKRGNTRLNMLTRLSAGGDNVDHFKFDTEHPGKTKLNVLGSDDAQVQVLNKFGDVFADSKADPDSKKYKNYTRLLAGELKMAADNYAVRVKRPEGVSEDRQLNVGVQLSQGDFQKDLDLAEANNPFKDEIENAERAQPVAGQAEQFQKEARDVKGETGESLANARDIGRLVENRSRLNLVSTFRDDEKADHYKFEVYRGAKGRMSTLNSGKLQFELLDKQGNVIADSEAKQGSDKQKAFERLEKGQFEFEKGEYRVRVSAKEGADLGKGQKFGFQLTQGDQFSKDYNVIEQGLKQKTQSASKQYDQLARLGQANAGKGVANLLQTASAGLPSPGGGSVAGLLGGGGGGGILGAVGNSLSQQYNAELKEIQAQNPDVPLGGGGLPGGGLGGGGLPGGGLGGGGRGGGINSLI